MKKFASIVLTAAFLVQCTSQLWIMAAFKMNQDYIVANLCINRFDAVPICKGSCYLAKQLDQEQKQQQKFPELKDKEITLFCQSCPAYNPNNDILPKDDATYPCLEVCFTASEYLGSVFHPPASAV